MSYLDTIRAKREAAAQQQDSGKKDRLLIHTSKDTAAKIAGEVARQSAKSRISTQKVAVENKDLARSADIEELVRCVKALGEQLKPEGIDWQPVETALNRLSKKVDALPKAFPDIPEPLSEVAVNNLQDISEPISEVVKAIQSLELNPVFDPKITVKPAEVRVTESKLDVSPVVQAIEGLKPQLELLKSVTEQKDDTQLLSTIKETTKAINSLQFPVPNYVLPFKSVDGKATQVQLDENGNIPVAGSSSSTTYLIKNTSPPDDPEIATYKYFGFVESGGTKWRIMRKTLSDNSYDYATGTSGYATAWTNRANEEYS